MLKRLVTSEQEMPKMQYRSSTVPYKDSFLIVGGAQIFHGPTDKIFEYDSDAEGLTEMDAKLEAGLNYGVAVLIPDGMMPDC